MARTTQGPVADTLLERVTASEGIDFDGLRLEVAGEGESDEYRLETPTTEREGLTEDELRDALSDPESDAFQYATNWHYWHRVGGEGTYRRAFLRWCERAPLEVDGDENRAADGGGTETLAVPDRYDALADGLEREWGQLLITTEVAMGGDELEEKETAGERTYHLRHVDDADADLADLEIRDRPREARDLTTSDEKGRYRPLKTAPTLVSGWAFADLSGDELVDAVDFFYPATVANWHRELHDALDVDHWLETAERQTGIYDVVDELPREAVEWMTEACCVDSQCLRRREWHYEEDDELETPGGDGEFPCREPCSLVIAAARKWAILETEEERTWEFELTTSEKNQLEALIDAVADGRIDEIREADLNDGANRYRARYLRAKRIDDEGNLGGVDSAEETETNRRRE